MVGLRPLSGCGVEVDVGSQLVDALSELDSAQVREALRSWPALLIRGQQQLRLGGLDVFAKRVLRGPVYDPREHGAELPDPEQSWSYLVTNVADRTTGRVREGELVSGDRAKGSAGNHQFHTDYCWKQQINPVTMLLCRRFTCTHGGQTQLADTHAALEALPTEMRQRARGLRTKHGGVNFPAVQQPLVVRSPLSGREALLVGRHAKGLLGLNEGDSAALLDTLNTHCTRSEFVLTHLWREGDLLLWDNTSTLHRALEGGGGIRELERCVVAPFTFPPPPPRLEERNLHIGCAKL